MTAVSVLFQAPFRHDFVVPPPPEGEAYCAQLPSAFFILNS